MSIGSKNQSNRTQEVQRVIENELAKYNHVLRTRVRTYDVDRQGIVHNAVYLYWLEAARVEYFRAIGLPLDRESFVTKHRFVVAHAEIDYFYAAQFDDEYEIYTRIPWVKNSSFGFEQIIRLTDGRLLVKSSAILVHLNPATHQPERIQEAYRKLVKEFEGGNVHFMSA
ncbi:MAG: acyl-CoA thioesterase [Candidatus Kapabacteria bacterium]|nr:acyl-CoA thioesterase [Candidatus Kapabacteria bacterium]